MPKKLKPKKGGSEYGGKGGASGEEGKERMTEVDKEWFQIQIRSLEEKLQRRNDKMKQLEQSNVEYQEKYEELRDDKADIIAYLKRTLQQRTDQITELQARLEGLQQVHLSDGEKYNAHLVHLKQESAKTKEQLVSENMVLTKKLDALEEFRIQREQLMSKFEDQEKKRVEIRQVYEDKIEKMEKENILEQDRLKREMTKKLENVAAEFRKVSHAQMAATTQRTIRENVGLSAQITTLSDKITELTCDNDVLEYKNNELQKSITALKSEQKTLMNINAFRLRVIEELSSRCMSQNIQVEKQLSHQTERKKYEDKINRLENELQEANHALNSNIAFTKEKDSAIEEVKRRLAGLSKTKDVINDCLKEASGSIKAALALQVKLEDPDLESDSKIMREKVLNQLLIMLNTAIGEKKKEIEPDRSSSSIKQESSNEDIDYMHGSLGLVPWQ